MIVRVLGQSQFLSSSIFHHPKEKEQFMLLGDPSIVLLWWWVLAQRVLTLYLTLTLGVETYLLFQRPTFLYNDLLPTDFRPK